MNMPLSIRERLKQLKRIRPRRPDTTADVSQDVHGLRPEKETKLRNGLKEQAENLHTKLPDGDGTDSGDCGRKSSASSHCSDLWDRAFLKAQEEPQWDKFCTILEEESSKQMIDAGSSDSNSRLDTQITINSLDFIDVTNISKSVKTLALEGHASQPSKFHEICLRASKSILAAGSVGSALASLNPYASLAWGLVQFLAGAVNNNRELRGSCWGRLKQLEELVCRCQFLHEFHHDQKATSLDDNIGVEINNVMIDLFAAIINYQVAVVVYNYSSRKKLAAMVKNISDNETEKYFKSVQDHEQRFLNLRGYFRDKLDIDKFNNLESRLASSQCSLRAVESRLGRLESQVSEASRKLNGEYYRKVLAWISSIMPDEAHDKASRLPMAGTTDWLFITEEYKTWAKSSTANGQLFWLLGKMGCGKTCVTHSVIDYFKNQVQRKHESGVLYFYCDGTDSTKLATVTSVTAILRCFLRQIVARSEEKVVPECVIELYESQAHIREPSIRECRHLIKKLLKDMQDITMIIDGLDECVRPIRGELVDALVSILNGVSVPWKLYISSRNEFDIEDIRKRHDTEQRSTYIIDVEDHNEEAINAVIDKTVRESASLGSRYRDLYVSGAHDQTQDVISQLKLYAQGMFRWVSLSIDYLHGSRRYQEMVEARKNLAHLQDLFDLYDILYKRIMKEARGEKIAQAIRTMLTIVLHGFYFSGTSSMEYIADACSIVDEDAPDVQNYMVEDIAAFCPSLVEFKDGQFILPHFSVREYLEDRRGDHYSTIAANAWLAARCMAEFDNRKLTPALSDYDRFVRYATENWYTHLRRVKLQGTSRDAIQVECEKKDISFLSEQLEKFLLSTAAPAPFQRWHEAAVCFNTVEKTAGCLVTKPLSTIFARISLNIGWKDDSLSFHELNVRSFRKDEGCMGSQWETPLAFAVTIGALPVIRWLVEEKQFDPHQKDREGGNLLDKFIKTWEAEKLNRAQPEVEPSSVFQLLLGYGLDPQAFNDKGESLPFRLVSRHYKTEMLDLLRSSGIGVLCFDRSGRSLFEASFFSSSIDSQCSFRRDIADDWLRSSHWDDIKSPSLCLACRMYDFEMALFCLENGADPMYRDQNGVLPIEHTFCYRLSEDTSGRYERLLHVLTFEMLQRGFDLSSIASRPALKWAGCHLPRPYFYNILCFGDLDTIQVWVENGAQTDIKMKKGKTEYSYPTLKAASLSKNHSKEVKKYFRSLLKAKQAPSPPNANEASMNEQSELQSRQNDPSNDIKATTAKESEAKEIEAEASLVPAL